MIGQIKNGIPRINFDLKDNKPIDLFLIISVMNISCVISLNT